MTITIAWVRRVNKTAELVVASDSRLRSYGAMDQCQKIFPLQRGDSALAFCGDAGVAYPFFVQAASALNGWTKTRTRADDIYQTAGDLERILNNLIDSWDAPISYKSECLADTRILFCGWSWSKAFFVIGFFKFIQGKFAYLQATERLSKPWREKRPSLIVLGDYRPEYMRSLSTILHSRHPGTSRWLTNAIDLDFEPLEALHHLLGAASIAGTMPLIGGAPQLIKIYSHSNVLPITVRTSLTDHFIFGRKLASWEKTEHPIANLTKSPPSFLYPLSWVPKPSEL
jgi:hypothetical protein